MRRLLLIAPFKNEGLRAGQYLSPPAGLYRIASYIKKKLPELEIVIYDPDLEGEDALSTLFIEKKFDIVIVDGRDRVNCVKNAIDSIKENGIIILDDSERMAYSEGVNFLLNNNFSKLDFWGISPGLFYKKNTTIFYRKDNCLNI